MTHHWNIEDASAADAKPLAKLIFDSAPNLLTRLLCEGDQAKALAYLRFALTQASGQYGYQNHRVIKQDDRIIGVGCAWHDGLAADFDQSTLQSLHQFFGIEACVDILQRSALLSQQIAKPTPEQLVIGHLSTVPDMQRQGVAGALINHFTQQAKALHKQQVVVDVEMNNTAALQCYQKLGFEQQDDLNSKDYLRLIKFDKF